MLKTYDIELVKHGRKIQGKSGRSLMEALAGSSIFLRSDCGGRGTCGKCRVNRIKAAGEKISIASCKHELKEDIRIEIPKSSRLSSHIINKPPVSFPPSFIKRLKANASSEKRYGVAVDLGTTTIAIYLCNTLSGEVISSLALKNPQSLYGDDVMSRIGVIGAEKSNLGHMQKLVVNGLEWGVLELVESHALKIDEISQIVAVGNPTMIHILSGVDPEPIGHSPYQPAFHEGRTIDANSIGLDLRNTPLRTLPQVSGFIGGDILAAALATDFKNQPDGTLLIDLGTNGELLLKAGEKLFATSCATGPAFEGASLTCGMQAIPGAINRIEIKNTRKFPSYTMIKSKKEIRPMGICGTGVISTVAELRRKRIIDESGAFIEDATIKPLQKDQRGKTRYIIVAENMDTKSASIFINQKDIRSVQLGKAALISGIDFITKAAGYHTPGKIIIAGAFGSHSDIKDMITIGMIPEMKAEKIVIAGNSAGAGAVMVLSDDHYFRKSVELAENITTIDLATNISFQKVFVEKLIFPSC